MSTADSAYSEDLTSASKSHTVMKKSTDFSQAI